MRENFHSNNTKYPHTKPDDFSSSFVNGKKLDFASRKKRSVAVTSWFDFQTVAIYSPITGVNEGERGAISTGNYSDTCSPTRSIDLKNGKSRGERISPLKTGVVVTLYSRIVSLRGTPRAVISIVFFRGKTRKSSDPNPEKRCVVSRIIMRVCRLRTSVTCVAEEN